MKKILSLCSLALIFSCQPIEEKQEKQEEKKPQKEENTEQIEAFVKHLDPTHKEIFLYKFTEKERKEAIDNSKIIKKNRKNESVEKYKAPNRTVERIFRNKA